ncbi:hypothetical protein APR04_003087 [Promicromonospora umidemergens]|uniref:Uncharacterized protein n=1 Tax=Promicromonospora umidemergens TaxID=629679 RepID=A0ABP8Y181_9MICO|nr:hypothetical protein [Promicromonospora umidemergens]
MHPNPTGDDDPGEVPARNEDSNPDQKLGDEYGRDLNLHHLTSLLGDLALADSDS